MTAATWFGIAAALATALLGVILLLIACERDDDEGPW